MNINDVVFIDNLPKLDLHGYTSQEIKYYIDTFINDNYKLKNEFINIIHGIGTGTLRQKTHEILKNNQKIIEYKTYYYNNGCTIAHIKLK